MKNKKRVAIISAILISTLILSSCAIDKKCPAYTKAETTNQANRV